MDDATRQQLLATIQAFVGRHQAATDALEDAHLDHCIDEAQQTNGDRHTLSPFLPTKPEDVVALLELLEIGPHHLILDLGCGDGRVLTAAAMTRGCAGVGVDISEECITLAWSIAVAEGVGERLVTFHALDLLAHQPALAFLAQHADQAAPQEANSITEIVVFLYVYPTLLARLDALIDGLVQRLSSRPSSSAPPRVKVVTLTYHFRPETLPHLARMSGAGDGRFVVYVLPGPD